MRRIRLQLLFLSVGLALVIWMFLHAGLVDVSREAAMNRRRQWVGKLELTDLCLFTDARYTRHLSMADLHTPFQDHPMALEHFPSGSIFGPPSHLRVNRPPESHANL